MHNLSAQDFIYLRGSTQFAIDLYIKEKKNLTVEAYLQMWRLCQQTVEDLKSFQVLYPGHADYPKIFFHVVDPPVFLCANGNLNWLNEELITVVGSRRAMPDFLQWMNEHYLHYLLKTHAVTVSGGAFGIDYKATSLALFAGTPSIVILPSGFCSLYPRHVNSWKDKSNILLLSEYFPDQELRPYHFIHRNRLLGTMSTNVLVVQCAVKSGTMTTAQYAVDHGRQVLTLPDFPGRTESSGNLRLLRDGATLVSNSDDLIGITSSISSRHSSVNSM